MSSLLLVEFAASDRFHRAVAFPFLHGLARSKGIASRWLRFGLKAARAMNQQGQGIVLNDSDKGRLHEAIATYRPRLVIFQPRPGPQLAEMLQTASPGSELFCLEDDRQGGGPGTGHLAPGSITTRQLASRLAGQTVGNLFEKVVPDFSFEPANELAARMPPLPFLLLGEECLYNRPFSDNSFLAGLDLSTCVRRGGCSFCTRPANRGGWHTNPVALFRRQLRAITETLPLHPPRLELRLVGEPAWQHLEAICNHTARTCRVPLDLLVDCRADNFLRWRTRLKRALGRLRNSPHRLEMSLVGVENFSSAELHRLNKGFNPATNLAAIELLFAFERDYGKNFGFRRHGGLSLITFTPWTRPADLALNLAVVEALGIEHLCGKLLSGRLRLYPELPLYLAARRDNLLASNYADPLLDTARANMYGREIPWRFQHPALEAVNRLLLRLDAASTGPPEDALAQRLRGLAEQRRAAGTGRIQLALEIIDLALSIDGKEAVSTEAVVQLLEASIPARKTELPAAAESWLECNGSRAPGQDVLITREMLLAVKPVLKLEPLREADARRLQQSGELPHATLRRRGGGQRQEVFELFCGRRQSDVETAVQLAGEMDRASGQGLRGMTRRMGRLLGYPRCCARAFSDVPLALLDDLFWLHVARRVAEPGPVPWQMNPAGNLLLEYVPCSLHCQDTRKRYAALLKKIRAGDSAETERLEEKLKNPSLIFRGAQGSFVELVAEGQPGERFRYRAGASQGTGRLLEAVCQGDELVIEPECLIVLRRGRQRAALSARAFLWWHRRAFQVEFWRALVQVLPLVKASLSHQDSRARQAETAGFPATPRPSPAALRLAGRLQPLRDGKIAFAGYRLGQVKCLGGDKVRVTFAGPGKELVMDIAPRHRGAPYYLVAGRFFLTYPLSHPLDTPAQEAAARAFASRLANF